MAEKIPMLALSPTMEEGLIVKWVKQEGEEVTEGDVLCEVETDKATMEYESPAKGVLLKILTKQGESTAVGKTIAVIGEAGEDIPEIVTEEKASPPAEPTAVAKIRSSPLARKLAGEYGVDITSVTGSGPQGRVTAEDIEQAGKGKTAVAEGAAESIIEVSAKRKTIAKRLCESKFSAPHYYLTLTVVAEDLLTARQKLNARRETKVSLNAFLIKFAAESLKRHQIINSTWQQDRIIQYRQANIAIAVSQPDGLIAPVVRDCGSKGIIEIDAELRELIEKAKVNKLSISEISDATFTISNLGAYGIEEFTAIINPPGSAILAVGKISKTPLAGEGDKVELKQAMKLTLSCDHRVIDGVAGAEFLEDLKEMIECPIRALY